MTATPGDLSALAGWLLDKAAREPSAAEQHMLREAVAALSALPAGGGRDLIRLDFIHADGHEDCKLITHDEMRQRYADALADAHRPTPPADADVGAQGKDCDCGCNEPAFTEPMEALRFLSGRMKYAGIGDAVALSYARDIDRILESAAPAAGKGVPVAWSRAEYIYDEDGRPIGTDEPRVVWGSENPDPDEGWHPLYEEAALTRQPVAGDGMVLVPREPTPKMIDATWNDPAEEANGGGIESHNTRNERIYKAMIAAAPGGRE